MRQLISIRLMAALALLAGGLVLASGCSSEPGMDKRFGWYTQFMDGTPEQIESAAHHVLSDMGYHPMRERREHDRFEVRYRTSFDTRVTVKGKTQGFNHMQVQVKVTPGESEGLSQTVLQRIQKRLAETEASRPL